MRQRPTAPLRRGIFALAASFSAVGLASSSRAQSANVLGKDDAAFARLLYQRGYADLAEQLCATIEKAGTVSPEGAIGVKALHLDLRLDLASREPDPIARKEAIKKILDEKEDLIEQYPSTKEAEEAGNSLPDVYRKLGETITLAIQKEKEPAKIQELQREGEQFYTRAEEQIEKRIAELAEDHATPDKERVYIGLLYNLPRTRYYHSLLYPEGEWKKKDLLEKVIEGFQQFGLDWSDTFLYYEGVVLMGLADKDLGRNPEALADFDEAIGLAERFEPDAKGVFQVGSDVADVVSGGVLQKVLFQTELKDYAGAIATAKRYFDTIPSPYEARNGLAVLAARAEAEWRSGDAKAANETAQKLVELDERGIWGAKGREIQANLIGGGGQIDAASTLKIAGTMMAKGNGEKALEICRQAIAGARGTENEAKVGVEAYLLMGEVYRQRGAGWNFEMAQCYDSAIERWPNAEKTPEVVYQSMLAWLRINQEDKRPSFKKRADDREKMLLTQFPNHPRSFFAQLNEAEELENEGKYLEAAERYQKIQPTAASYLQAQFGAGNSYFRAAAKLCAEKKEGEAAQYVKQAETLLKKAKDDLDAAVKNTMDLEAQSRFESTGFRARASLAQLYLLDCVNKPGEVLTVLEGVDDRYAADGDKIAAAWGFRISALEKQGKLDEAVALLDSLVKKDPESRAIAVAAGTVARALDKRADELTKQNKAREAEEQLKRAAVYYTMSGRALAKSGSVRSSALDAVANRLFALGLHFNGVPEGKDTFVGWNATKTRDTNLWKSAEELYTAALELAPNYQNQIKLGRTLGFLGLYDRATDVYGRLFDTEAFVDTTATPPRFNATLARQKPELFLAYLEWGVAAAQAAQEARDQEQQEMFLRAGSILDNLVRDKKYDTPTFWQAKYWQIRNLMNQGKYPEAGGEMRMLERENTELGGPAGMQNDFKALKDDVSKKAFNGNGKTQSLNKSDSKTASPAPNDPNKPR